MDPLGLGVTPLCDQVVMYLCTSYRLSCPPVGVDVSELFFESSSDIEVSP